MQANIFNDFIRFNNVRKFKGFTLLELMIVILIVAIFAGIAVPSFNNQYQKSVAKSSRDVLFQDLQYARSQSITRSAPVTICEANPDVAERCGSGDWNQGWIIFIDSNGDGTVDADEKIVRHHYITNTANAFKQSQASPFITFLPNGKARFNGDSLTYHFCYLEEKRSADVVINHGGQANIIAEGQCS